MNNKQVDKALQKSARLVLQAVTAIARSNANSFCRGLMYEPKVPTQLKKSGGSYHEENQANGIIISYGCKFIGK